MPGIALKNGLISYYGNPAGYTKKDTAVVDRMFQNNELEIWLKNHSIKPNWMDGVMEQLLSGEVFEDTQAAVPLKNVRIWQLKAEADIYMKFISYKEMKEQFGQPNQSDYRIAYDGQIGTNDLESIYERCSINHPSGYQGHSLSMSDVVELYDASGSEFHYCDRFGFKQINFVPEEQTQGMDYIMTQSF